MVAKNTGVNTFLSSEKSDKGDGKNTRLNGLHSYPAQIAQTLSAHWEFKPPNYGTVGPSAEVGPTLQ